MRTHTNKLLCVSSMSVDQIIEIGIDSEERLYVKPESKSFPYIYREAMEVHWDEEKLYLYGAKPRKWTYLDWFLQIHNAAKQQGYELTLTENCRWANISTDIKGQIINEFS